MKKVFMLSGILVSLFTCTFAQELSKDEKKRLKDEIKSYLNDLEGYKAKMEDIRVTLDSNDAEIKGLKGDLAAAAAKQAETENKLSDYMKELQRCHDESEILRGNPYRQGDTTTYPEGKPVARGEYVVVRESESPGSSNYASDRERSRTDNTSGATDRERTSGDNSGAAPDNQRSGTDNSSSGQSQSRTTSESTTRETTVRRTSSTSGTVYKVQVGLFEKFNINEYFDEPKAIDYEKENGMNRYVISDFRDENTAMSFVDDVRKMGIRDAFVAKYIDGVRVYEWSKNPKYQGQPVPSSLNEALEMEKRNKKGKKIN